MGQRCFCLVMRFLFVSALCAIPVNAQDSDAYLSKILQAVQKNVDFQKEQIVDFLSKEEITIEEFDNKGNPTKTVNIVSNYRVFPETTSAISDCHIVSEILESVQPVGILREEREVLSTKEDGIEVNEFTEDVWAKGNNYVDLFIVFDRQNEKCFEYKLKGIGEINGRNVYAIGIKQKGNDIGKGDIEGNDIGKKKKRISKSISWTLRYEGVALIDAATLEIVQLNRDGVDYNITYEYPQATWSGTVSGGVFIPKGAADKYIFFTQYEYGKVKIGDQFLTLPVAKIVRLFRKNGQLASAYRYSYSDHKAFGVNTKIKFEAIEESSSEIEN